MSAWHRDNRATEAGREAERQRNHERYVTEARRRCESARSYYWRNHSESVEYSRSYRKDHPERRRLANDRRAKLARENPGYVPFTHVEWLKLVRRHGGKCAYCGAKPDRLVKDHIIPLSRGGRHALANIAPSCFTCNARKGANFLSVWRLRSRV